jgi:hypothetical protein
MTGRTLITGTKGGPRRLPAGPRLGRSVPCSTTAQTNYEPSMNDEQIKQLLRELSLIRICAIVIAAIFVLAALNGVFRFFN